FRVCGWYFRFWSSTIFNSSAVVMVSKFWLVPQYCCQFFSCFSFSFRVFSLYLFWVLRYSLKFINHWLYVCIVGCFQYFDVLKKGLLFPVPFRFAANGWRCCDAVNADSLFWSVRTFLRCSAVFGQCRRLLNYPVHLVVK